MPAGSLPVPTAQCQHGAWCSACEVSNPARRVAGRCKSRKTAGSEAGGQQEEDKKEEEEEQLAPEGAVTFRARRRQSPGQA